MKGVKYITKKILAGIILTCIVVASYSLYSLFAIHGKYNASEKAYTKVEIIHKQPIEQSVIIEQLNHINNDYFGWIQIDNTTIDYPIVKAEENEFYLTHNFDKEADFAGAIFMDYRNSNDGLDKHTIIYGHNMKDNSMFGGLKKYLTSEYLNKHKIIKLEAFGEIYTWEIFDSYITDEISWMKTEFNGDEFTSFLNELSDKSIITQQAKLTEDDMILTLSTCTVNSTKTERNLVHAKLIKKE